VARLKAAASLAVPGGWFPLFVDHYDSAAGLVRMTATDDSGQPVEMERTPEQVAELIRSRGDWNHSPVVVIGENSTELARSLVPLLHVDTVGSLDRGLQDSDGETWAARIATEPDGTILTVTPDGDPIISARPGNHELWPASGQGSVLLGPNLKRALEAEVPDRIRGAQGEPGTGVTKPEESVAWTTRPRPRVIDPAAPVPPPVPPRPRLRPLGTAPLRLARGLMAERVGPGGAVRVYHNGAPPARRPASLPVLDGHLTVLPDPDLSQGEITRAIDRLLTSPSFRGSDVLLLARGAGGEGEDSFAHRIQLRHEESGLDANPLDADQPATGPVIVAPSRSWLWNDEGLHTGGQWWRFAPGTDPQALGPVHPDVEPLADGAEPIFGSAEPDPTRPLAELSPTGAVTGARPLEQWLRDGHQLRQPTDTTHLLTPTGPGQGAVAEITATGLWIRQPGDLPAWAGDLVRGAQNSGSGLSMTLGVPGEPITTQEWELAWHLVRHLPPALTRNGQLHLAADTSPADMSQARRLAAAAGLSLPEPTVAPPHHSAYLHPRVVPVGPLPAHHIELEALPAAEPIPELAPPEPRSQTFDHGIPFGQVTGPEGDRFELGSQVVPNRTRIERAYITIPRTAAQASATPFKAAAKDGQHLALPGEGFFRARSQRPDPAGEHDMVLEVSIPPGAAILPRATSGTGPMGGRETESWLPPNALARVRVVRAFEHSQVFGSSVSVQYNDLARRVAGVPQAGHAEVQAPWWAWSDAEIGRYFLPGSATIPAGLHFPDPGLATADQAAARRAAHRIAAQGGETVLDLPVTKSEHPVPLLNGREASPQLLTRVLRILTRRDPGLDHPLFRLAGGVDPDHVRDTVNLSRRPMVNPTPQVFVIGEDPAHDGLLHGTLIATTMTVGSDGTPALVMPPTGHWTLHLPGQPAVLLGLTPAPPRRRPPPPPPPPSDELGAKGLSVPVLKVPVVPRPGGKTAELGTSPDVALDEPPTTPTDTAKAVTSPELALGDTRTDTAKAVTELTVPDKTLPSVIVTDDDAVWVPPDQPAPALPGDASAVQAGLARPQPELLVVRPRRVVAAEAGRPLREQLAGLGTVLSARLFQDAHHLPRGQETTDALAAAAVEARGLGGAATRDQAWNDLVTDGTGHLPRFAGEVAYAVVIPGLADPGGLVVGQVLAPGVAVPARAQVPGTVDPVFVITGPDAVRTSDLTGLPGDLMFAPGTVLHVTGISTSADGRTEITLAHQPVTTVGDQPVTPQPVTNLSADQPADDQPADDQPADDQPVTERAALQPGWAWLDEESGLAVPVRMVAAGFRTFLSSWLTAEPGGGTGYAFHPGSGLIVTTDQSVISLTNGWIPHNSGLLHRATGYFLTPDGALTRPPGLTPAQRHDLTGSQLNADDLGLWLGRHGAVTDPQLAPGWVARSNEDGSLWWRWNGDPGIQPTELPPGFTRGTASGQNLQCLIDTLRQLTQQLLPPDQRDQVTREALADWLRTALPRGTEGYQQLMTRQTIDIQDVLPTFTQAFAVRVQVFEYRRAGDTAAHGSVRFTTNGYLVHPPQGPDTDDALNPTPIIHLVWSYHHFEPLYAPATPVRLTLRQPLATTTAGTLAAAVLTGPEQFRAIVDDITEALAAHPDPTAFLTAHPGFQDTYTSQIQHGTTLHDQQLTQYSPERAQELRQILGYLRSLQQQITAPVPEPVPDTSTAQLIMDGLDIIDQITNRLTTTPVSTHAQEFHDLQQQWESLADPDTASETELAVVLAALQDLRDRLPVSTQSGHYIP
jgi:hypothetical protein